MDLVYSSNKKESKLKNVLLDEFDSVISSVEDYCKKQGSKPICLKADFSNSCLRFLWTGNDVIVFYDKKRGVIPWLKKTFNLKI